MIGFIIRRLVEAIPLLLLVIVINFVLIHTAPGDPIFYFLGAGAGTTPEHVERLKRQFGLDKPLAEQLLIYISNVSRGRLGYSLIFQQPVLRVILERVPLTLLLIFSAMLLATIAGIAVGVFASRRPLSLVDNATTALALFGYSVPVFWLGQMLIVVFSIYLGWLPTGGIRSFMGERSVLDFLSHLILPALSLSVIQLAIIARLTRANMLEIFSYDYIKTAHAKGLSEAAVTYKHALRNALLPVVTIINMNFSLLLTGAVLTETVFSWPGLGRLMFESLYRRDYPVLMGLLISTSIGVVLINLITDLMYAYLDPRVVYD